MAQELEPIMKRLQVERPGAYFDPRVKRGLIPPYDCLYNVVDGALIVPIGLTYFLGKYGVQAPHKAPEFTFEDIQKYLGSLDLPFTPYKHQVHAFYESLLRRNGVNLMCTGSGKSLTISLLADFLRIHGRNGLLVVPNVNLLTQFKSDIKDYNLMDLYNNTFTIGGGQTIRDFSHPFTISTWQSLMNSKKEMINFDYILVDETHKAKGEQLQDIIQKSINAEYKLGFTGTLNDNELDRMTLFGLFGEPKTYIRTHGLVELGLATPVEINAVQFLYNDHDKALFRHTKGYAKQLTFIKEHERRNHFIATLSSRLSQDGNTLVLFQHTAHGKELFTQIMNKKYPDVKITNKDIVGKNAYDFQRQYKVYFINGEVDAKIREQVRLILEHDTDAILVANYAVLSTGVNIKNLHNMILASPMKSFTTITQSIGRGVRLHISKSLFKVYDLVDKFTPKGTFMKQYLQRKEQSYMSEGFPINEKEISL